MALPDADVIENYRRLKDERGLSWDQLAAQIDKRDHLLAAWLRSQAAAESNGASKPTKRTAPPKQTAEE